MATTISSRYCYLFKNVLKHVKTISSFREISVFSANNSNYKIRFFIHKPKQVVSYFSSNAPQIPVATVKEETPNAGSTETEEDKKKRESSWKTMKYTFIFCGATFGILGSWMLYALGSPQQDEFGAIIEDEFSNLPAPQQYFKRIWSSLDYFKRFIREPSRDKLLPDPLTYPYIQPPYTLVLEMTDVLVHPDWTYKTGWRFKKRPGVDHFFEQVAPPMFEIVVFTAEQGMTVFPILDALDPNGYIMYRLVRDATHFVDGHHVKNLDNLNRDLTKVIVVDWNGDSVKLHPRNTLLLQRWRGNDDDHTLADLASFLRTIAAAKVEDVRDVLDYYHQFDNPIEAFRENQRKLVEQMEEKEKLHTESTRGSLTHKWSSSFLHQRKL